MNIRIEYTDMHIYCHCNKNLYAKRDNIATMQVGTVIQLINRMVLKLLLYGYQLIYYDYNVIPIIMVVSYSIVVVQHIR